MSELDNPVVSKRLESLDVLRGFDLFCLTILCPFLHAFSRVIMPGCLR